MPVANYRNRSISSVPTRDKSITRNDENQAAPSLAMIWPRCRPDWLSDFGARGLHLWRHQRVFGTLFDWFPSS